MFINRDENHKINALFCCQQYEGQECLEDSEPEVQEFLNPPIITKSESLLKAENAYINFCKSLGFGGKASTEEIKTKSEEIYDTAQTMDDKFNAIKIPLTALGLINEITQLGGNWENIGE